MERLLRMRVGRFRFPGLESARGRAALGLGLSLAWALLVIGVYYTKLWGFLLRPRWRLPVSFDLTPSLPFAGEAFSRLASGLLAASVLIVSAALLGAFLLRLIAALPAGRAGLLDASVSLPFSAALGFGAFAYAGLLLALLGLCRPEILRLLVALPLLGGAFAWLRRGFQLPRRIWPFLRSKAAVLPKSDLLWWGCTALAVGFALIAALAPEREFDALWYHLAYPQRYLQAGRLVDLPYDYVSLYPMTWELWYGYGLAMGGQIASKLLDFACLPLTALALAAFVRRFIPRVSPALSVALFALAPTVIWEASTANNDLPLALYLALALFALFAYAQESRPHWLLLAALNLGLALAIKHLALVALLLAAAGLVLYRWRTTRSLRSAILPSIFLGLLPLALACPWYLRSYFATGNPVFPELYGLFGAPSARWDALTQRGLQAFLAKFGPPRTLPGLLSLPWHSTIHAASYGGTLGPLFLVLLPVLAFSRLPRALKWLGAFVVLFIAFWASPLSSFQMRFLIPFVPFLAVLAAAAFTRLQDMARRISIPRLLIPSALVVLLLLNLPPFTAFHEHDRSGWQGWLSNVLYGIDLGVVFGTESQEAYLARNVASYAVWQFANLTLPPDAYVLAWSNGDQFYSQRPRLWINAAMARPAAWAGAGQEDGALANLRRLGITHLIIDKRDAGASDMALLSPAVRAAWYEILYEDRYYVLYRLRWEALPPTAPETAP